MIGLVICVIGKVVEIATNAYTNHEPEEKPGNDSSRNTQRRRRKRRKRKRKGGCYQYKIDTWSKLS